MSFRFVWKLPPVWAAPLLLLVRQCGDRVEGAGVLLLVGAQWLKAQSGMLMRKPIKLFAFPGFGLYALNLILEFGPFI